MYGTLVSLLSFSVIKRTHIFENSISTNLPTQLVLSIYIRNFCLSYKTNFAHIFPTYRLNWDIFKGQENAYSAVKQVDIIHRAQFAFIDFPFQIWTSLMSKEIGEY